MPGPEGFWMKYFWDMPGRVWSVSEGNSLNIEMS